MADPGDTITLEWTTTDAVQVGLYRLLGTGQLGTFWEVGHNGSFVYDIAEHERNSTRFALAATDAQGVTRMATLSVRLRCTAAWFISSPPDICPTGPALVSAAAEQHFQRGVMIWVEAEDRILVLFDDGNSPRWKPYRDEWDAGEPVSDPELVPPPGLYQPVRGFGLLWRTEPSVRERLGWAVDQEMAYQTMVQRTSYAKYNSTYVRALDGDVWYLRPEGSRWEKIEG